MSTAGKLRRLLRIPLPPRQQASADLVEEFELHLEMRAAELEAEGLSPEAARQEALRLFGDPERVRREMLRTATRHVREQRGREAVWNMVRDIRYATRSLLRSPAFTAVAVATLALGIGANTAIFSVVDAVLLERLPVPEPDRLAMIYEANEARGVTERNPGNPANFRDWRDRSEAFQWMAAIFTMPTTVLSGGEAQQVPMQLAHPDLFSALGVAPRLGRTFSPEEGVGEAGAAPVVVISHDFWRDHFGGDPDVLGKRLELLGSRPEVIGVMGPELEFFAPDLAFWMPTDYEWASRRGRFTRVVARLAPGYSMEAAQSEMERIMAGLREEHPDNNAEWTANVVPLDEVVKGDVRPALLVLLGAVGVLLLVTCVNMANLLLVRAASRRTEVAVRASLGAGRGRIIRGLLTESLLLSAVGGAVGVALAFVVTRVLVVALPTSLNVPRLDQATVDPGVLGFAALITLVTGALFGLAPALDAFRTDLIGQLREGGRGGGGGHRARRVRSAIVVGEVALSLMLLIGAGLLLRSFVELRRTDLGIEAQDVITGQVTMQGERYSAGQGRIAFMDQAIESIVTLPEVRAAGAISWLPLSGLWSGDSYYLPGPRPAQADMLPTEVQAVEGDIFQALGVPLLRGRRFTEADAPGAPEVVIINQALADQSWPGEDPIGKRIILTWGEDTELEVVGMVANVRQRGVAEQGHPGLYRPHAQFPEFGSMSIVVRARPGSEGSVARQVVSRIQDIDPNMAVAKVTTLRDVVAEAIAQPRLTSFVVAAFAALALLLAALGIYGVLAYAVSLRSQELGLRQALGARSAEVARMVLLDALKLAVIGVAIGGVAAALGARILSTQLYQVSPRDPVVFIGMPALLLAIALAAAAIPALRAARVRPTLAIREE
ncbi:MAG: ABC transporter permease [Gemmatimonadetes bacterium]|nr:ABC transporter permease [Gemmatimonadota bacterium]